MFNKIKYIFLKYPLQTFTYFIPAPPMRKQGYREKSFDNHIKSLVKMNFEIIDIKTQAVNNEEKSGMWVVVSIRALSAYANGIDLSDFPDEVQRETLQNLAHFDANDDNHSDIKVSSNNKKGIDLPNNDNDSEEIEGIYYID